MNRNSKRQAADAVLEETSSTSSSGRRIEPIESKYQESLTTKLEEQLRDSTVGLVSAENFREIRSRIEQEEENKKRKAILIDSKKKVCQKQRLSFLEEEEEEEEEEEDDPPSAEHGREDQQSTDLSKFRRVGMDPTAATSCLRDPSRDAEFEIEKTKIVQEYFEEDARLKTTNLEIWFCFFDTPPKKHAITIQRGATVLEFLKKAITFANPATPDSPVLSPTSFLFVKEDTIFPHNLTFHEVIKKKVKAPSGKRLLFSLMEQKTSKDVVWKEVGNVVKLVEEKWYSRNRHIYPASQWSYLDIGGTTYRC